MLFFLRGYLNHLMAVIPLLDFRINENLEKVQIIRSQYLKFKSAMISPVADLRIYWLKRNTRGGGGCIKETK